MKKTMTFEEILENDGHLAFTNKGISMRPLLFEGRDIMLIEKKTERPKKLDAVLFKRNGINEKETYDMHRILRVNNDGTYWIIGDNCISGETVKEEQVIGVLSGIIRKGKTISVTEHLYRL